MSQYGNQPHTWVEKQLRLRRSNIRPRVLLSVSALAALVGGGVWATWDYAPMSETAPVIAMQARTAVTTDFALTTPAALETKAQQSASSDNSRKLAPLAEQALVANSAGVVEAPLHEPKSSPVSSSLAQLPAGALTNSATPTEQRDTASRAPSVDTTGTASTLRQTPTEIPAIALPRPAVAEDDQQELIVRVATMIRQGDIAGARVILARLDRIGNTRATFALAQTYDPIMLNEWKVRGIKSDPGKALELYQRAADQGLRAAQERLAALALQQR